MTPPSQTMFIGSYHLLRPLGRGGMAEVWLARHAATGRQAAVKIILTQRALDDRFLTAFFDEAREHAALVHPNIAAIYDYGHIEPTDAPPPNAKPGLPFLVMEVADGALREHLPHSWSQTKHVLTRTLQALAFSHAHGIIHRDLKPENILVCGNELKLSDFGIVYALADTRTTTTDHITSSAGAGTPYYMAPEQLHAQWRDFGPWTDLYAFGCMAFELVCGFRPYEGHGLLNIAMKHLNGPFPAIAPQFPLPAGFEDWLAHLVSRNPRARFQFAADALDALMHLGDAPDAPDAPFPVPAEAPSEAEAAPTLIDALSATHDQVPTIHATEAMTAHGADLGDLNTPAPTRPVPLTWRGEPTHVVWSGLGLFGMRAPGLVGLEDAREKLWTQLMCANTSLHITTIRGTEAEPVDALSRWLSTRAHELGAARTLTAHHSRVMNAGQAMAGEGLAGLVDQMFALWGLSEAERLDRITSRLKSLQLPDDRTSMDADARTLVAESLADRRLGYSRFERFNALARVLKSLSTDRPLILCLEDAQWAVDALNFVNHLTQHHPDLHLLTLITCKNDRVEALSEVSLLLEELTAHHPTIDLRPLHAGELERWIEYVLPLDEKGRTAVIERCAGDPRLAMWLIDNAITKGAIAETNASFVFTTPLPSSAKQMFTDRIDALLGPLPADTRQAAAAWYESLAALEHANTAEHQAVLAFAGFESSAAERLFAESGLVTTDHNRMSFAHPVIREAIVDRMKTSQTWADWNQVCLLVLKELQAPSARLANHADEIDDINLRLRTYVQGIRDHQTSNLRLASRFAELASQLQNQATDRVARVDLNMLQGVLMHARGDLEGSIATVQAAEHEARTHGYLLVVARCSIFLAVRDCDRGAFQDALQRLSVCVTVFENLNEQEVLASALLLVGFCLTHLDRRVEAIGAYTRACHICESRAMIGQLAVTESYVANLYLDLGEFDRARQVAQAALKRVEPFGLAKSMGDIHLVLGEIERLVGNLDVAKKHYQESQNLLTHAGSRDAAIARFNLLLVLFAKADPSAHALLPGVRENLLASGYDYLAQSCDRLRAWSHGQHFPAGTDPDIDWVAGQINTSR